MYVESYSEGPVSNLDDFAEVWTPPNIILGSPSGYVVSRNEWAIIGSVIDTEPKLEVVPCQGLSARQRARLLATAVQIWSSGRDCLQGWYFERGVGWVVDVLMRQPPDPWRLRAESSFSRSLEGFAPLVLAGFS